MCFFVILVSRSVFCLQIFESESGQLGFLKLAFWCKSGCKKHFFDRTRDSDDFRVEFWCFSEALGAVFLTFAGLDFRGYPITRTPGGGANPRPIWHPLNHSKPWLQTCNQQLQDRWLLESNRPEDYSLKISRWYPKPGAVCPWQSGAGGFYISRFANHIFVHRFCFPAKPDSFLRSHLPTTFPDLNIPQQYFPISIFP